MGTPSGAVTLAEIARRSGVKAGAVSNWRRRHSETFPAPDRSTGRELFEADSVAAWLDHRTIAVNDLKAGEVQGTTYGARFRRFLQAPEVRADTLATLIWRSADRLRGVSDSSSYEDLILGLFYVQQKYAGRWRELQSAGPSRLGEVVRSLAHADQFLLPLDRTVSSVLSVTRGAQRLMDVIYLLDAVLPAAEQDMPATGSVWAGEVFSQLLDLFADARGRRAAVHTPSSVVRTLVQLVSPRPGERVYDAFCESGSFLVEAARHVSASEGVVSLHGHAPDRRSQFLAMMNLSLHGLEADLNAPPGMAIAEATCDHSADVVMTNPPFNLSDWGFADPADPRWRYGLPPQGNANFAWLQHVLWSLRAGGRAAVVMPNGASSTYNDRKIRAAMIEAGVIEAVIALPSQLFASTSIPVSLWLLRQESASNALDVLLVDARSLGSKSNRSRRELTPANIRKIVSTVTRWRCEGQLDEESGFAASVSTRLIRENDYVLVPGRYVGVTGQVDDNASDYDQIRDLWRRLTLLREQSVTADAMVDRQLKRFEECPR